MSANKIAETSTSTGTGDFTLDGAWTQAGTFNTGNRTFNSFYGLNHYFPYMIQDQSGNWEKGVGYLSGSTTLVRSAVTDNSLGTTANISFAAGSKLVMVPTDAGSDWQVDKDSAAYIASAHQFGQSAGTLAVATNLIYIQPFLFKRPQKIGGIAVEVTTGAPATEVRAAIYSVQFFNLSSCVLSKVTPDAVLDSSTAGFKDASVSANVGAGLYAAVLSSTGAPTLRINTSPSMDVGAYSSLTSSPSNVFRQSLTGAGSGLPSSVSGAITGHNTSNYRVFVRGESL